MAMENFIILQEIFMKEIEKTIKLMEKVFMKEKMGEDI